jgi:hypothetical protein
MYHRDRAIVEQLRGPLAHKRKMEDIYEDMLDKWLPQGPHISYYNNYRKKRIRGHHNRAAKRKRQTMYEGR